MKITQIRNATLIIEYNNTKFLIDPWLGPKDYMEGFDTAVNSEIRQPRVELPLAIEKIVDVDAVIITHIHPDHWDEYAEQALDKNIKVFVQAETDKEIILSKGFSDVEILTDGGINYKNITLYKTPTQHGKREILKPLCEKIGMPYDAMGVVFKAKDEKTLFLAGDTIWCEEVSHALEKFSPNVIVVNACAATVLNGERLIMNIDDVKKVLKNAENATIIASHMDTVSHLTVTRKDLNDFKNNNNIDNLLIPEDGEVIEFLRADEVLENKNIARKFYKYIANKEYAKAAELCSEDFIYYPQVNICLNGVDKFVEMERANMDPFGDFKMTTKFIVADNDRVAVYLTFEGNLLGDEWHNVKVSNKHCYMDFMTMLKFRDGKIIEKRAKYDRVFIYQQLGVEILNLNN